MTLTLKATSVLHMNAKLTDDGREEGFVKRYEYIGTCPICHQNFILDYSDPNECPDGCLMDIVQHTDMTTMEHAFRKGMKR